MLQTVVAQILLEATYAPVIQAMNYIQTVKHALVSILVIFE